MKKVLVLTAVLMFAGVSFASLTMNQWAANPVQNVGDLTFTLQSYTIADTVTADIWSYGEPFGSGVTFANFPANGTVKYTVAVNQSVAPGYWIDSVDLSNYDKGPQQNGVMTKLIVEENVTLNWGESYDVPDGVSALTIEDTFVNIVGSGSNQFHTVVPEPATLALLGLGGLLLRRKK